MRRDTVLIQPNGHAVLRFRSENPGVWLFHCHIEWHVTSGLTATFISSPLSLQNSLSIPSSHYDLCAKNEPPTPTVGNAAGNVADLLNLKGEPAPPAPLPEGFTTKGVVALVFSILNGVAMVAIIAWYGMLNGEAKEADAKDGVPGSVDENRPLLSASEPVAGSGNR
jgi:iron transport multicopper oxidase